MRKTIRARIGDTKSAIRALEKERDRLMVLQKEIVQRLLDLGAENVRAILTGHVYTGATIDSISVKLESEGKTVKGTLSVGSEAILFLEFGAGLIGYGHPRASEFGYGPGTYPGAGHWDRPGGWWYPTSDPALIFHVDKNGQGWGFSRGTKPLMPMHLTTELIKRELANVVLEVSRR